MKHIPLPLLAATASLLLAACGSTQTRPEEPSAIVWPQTEAPLQGAIGSPSGGMFLFEDNRARQIGDLLTVTLVEKTTAQKSASTSTSKDTSVSVGSITAFGQTLKTDSGISGSNSFDGSGDSAQSNSLSGSLTVTVIQTLPNGNLVIRGEKMLGLNQGSETVRIEGIVRAADIAPDNTVTSDRIGNARISYRGKGALADANAQGWLARFFNSPWMPF